ncbi:MAG: hypothetical protein HYU68_07555 [Bacteroidetes bacterium]|nr:hypothetical protein [Bacteroidota bacterium]
MKTILNDYVDKFYDDYIILFQYKGTITHAVITEILLKIKNQFSDNFIISNRIYSIVNELLENILYHQINSKEIIEIVILQDSKSYRIITFNYSLSKETEQLLQKSNFLNSSSIEEVKENYKDVLMNNLINNKGTIGVGLNLVRLKSNNKIIISIEEIEGYCIVIINVAINKTT